MLLGQILYTSVLSAHTIANQEKQSILQSLVKRQVLYDDSISIDSVIAWSEQLLPTLQSNEDRTTYFLLQLQLANAYTLRGDISLATNRAQLMYEEAKATDYQFGMVVANQAIGDAYNTIANMGDKALESYQDALTELSNISGQHPYRAQLLLKMSNVLQRKGRLEEAEKSWKNWRKYYIRSLTTRQTSFSASKRRILPFPMDTSHKTILMKQTSGSTKWIPSTNCTQRSSTGFTWIIPLPPTIEPWEIGTNNTGNKLWTSTPNCKQNTPVISAPRITAGLRWKKSISVKYKAWPWKPAESTRNCILL